MTSQKRKMECPEYARIWANDAIWTEAGEAHRGPIYAAAYIPRSVMAMVDAFAEAKGVNRSSLLRDWIQVGLMIAGDDEDIRGKNIEALFHKHLEYLRET